MLSKHITAALSFTTNWARIGLFFTVVTLLSPGTDGFDGEDAMSDNRGERGCWFRSFCSLMLKSHPLFHRAQTVKLLEQNLTNEKSRLIKEQIEREKRKYTECFGGVPGKAEQSFLSLRKQGNWEQNLSFFKWLIKIRTGSFVFAWTFLSKASDSGLVRQDTSKTLFISFSLSSVDSLLSVFTVA